MTNRLAYFAVMLGAALWGSTGLFVQNLYTYGFTPWEVVAIRLLFSALLITLALGIYRRDLLRFQLKDIPLFIGTGIVSIAFFNYFFFTVMEAASVSLAVVLLYTGPVFVAVMARFIFKEPFTVTKALALLVMVLGCAYTVGMLPLGSESIGIMAILFGIASGFFYALYSIFGKFLSGRYHSLTITAYSLIFGSVFLLFTSPIMSKAHLLTEPGVLLNGLGLALFATVCAYFLYTAGLTYIESSRAAILSIIEPVVAIAIGVLVFGDILSGWQTVGILLIFGAIALTVYGHVLFNMAFPREKKTRTLNE
ncbi:EamA family transporter [Bacillus sp. FJAT-44742]|uniref:EamA family transporter n=1 Tax=Bacillus sp. FJAT-44742 TaxID=2014005 RepID=UPI000C241784|nr:EamA family transporter [Bacillus sp. FJAT-44742]